jgi:hypothetical protein
MHIEVEHDERQQRFIARLDGLESYLRYARAAEDALDLRSTFVHPDVRGRGVGMALVRRALDHARQNGLGVIPTCWFVETVVDRHPAYRDLLRS